MDVNTPLGSIDRLNSHLNDALTQIGRTFRDANGADSKFIGTPRGQGGRVDPISKASSKFHEVLDEIEIEILQAKSVIERDVNAIRAARQERERAINGSKEGASGATSDLPVTVDLTEGADLLAGGLPDTTVMDSFDEFAAQGTALDAAAFAAIAGDAAKNDAGAPASMNGTDAKADTPDQANTQAGSGMTAGGASNVMVASAAADIDPPFDFDSMFGEAANTQSFDLDFGDVAGGDGGPAGGMNMDDLFNEIGASTSDFADLGASSASAAEGGGSGTAEDLDSLLPGLGGYVNVENIDIPASGTGDDFTMIDMTAGQTTTEGAAGGSTSSAVHLTTNTATTGAQDGSKPAAEAKGGTSTGDGANNADGGAGGDMGDMDDIFGDMLDVGNMEGANLDDFDWNM